ncbi:orotidine-5'-phosphate decarboxylase [Mycoplasma todarodis]|uniref:orotidine-5'-phosphate decarboxylase n=1 Tax=Mycoplasma todarodis TaxID=1937191 RepID=UPI003B3716D2
MEYNSKIIIACDFNSKEEVYSLVDKLKGKKLFLKLGMQLLYKEGFDFIKELKSQGHNIFIDLKVHDIPNTAKNAVKSIATYEPDFITIHALNGIEAMKAMQSAVENKNSKLLAVTILTSMGQEDMESMNINVPVKSEVDTLLGLAKKAGIWGAVSSAQESPMVKKHGMFSITPGIRLESDENQDQKRVLTPYKAIKNGSDFIVVGRTITQSKTPLKTYEEIESQIKKAEEENE